MSEQATVHSANVPWDLDAVVMESVLLSFYLRGVHADGESPLLYLNRGETLFRAGKALNDTRPTKIRIKAGE